MTENTFYVTVKEYKKSFKIKREIDDTGKSKIKKIKINKKIAKDLIKYESSDTLNLERNMFYIKSLGTDNTINDLIVISPESVCDPIEYILNNFTYNRNLEQSNSDRSISEKIDNIQSNIINIIKNDIDGTETIEELTDRFKRLENFIIDLIQRRKFDVFDTEKIKIHGTGKYVNITDINIGEVFRFEGKLYLKTSNYLSDIYRLKDDSDESELSDVKTLADELNKRGYQSCFVLDDLISLYPIMCEPVSFININSSDDTFIDDNKSVSENDITETDKLETIEESGVEIYSSVETPHNDIDSNDGDIGIFVDLTKDISNENHHEDTLIYPKNWKTYFESYIYSEINMKEFSELTECSIGKLYKLMAKYRKETGDTRRRSTNTHIYPENWEDVFNRYISLEITMSKASDELHMTSDVFKRRVKKYAEKNNIDISNVVKTRSKNRMNIINSKKFSKVYIEYNLGKITAKEAIVLLKLKNEQQFYSIVHRYRKSNNIKITKNVRTSNGKVLAG